MIRFFRDLFKGINSSDGFLTFFIIFENEN